jgi:hypothetical protein
MEAGVQQELAQLQGTHDLLQLFVRRVGRDGGGLFMIHVLVNREVAQQQ